MQPSDAWTIGQLLSWTAEYLTRSGSQTPRLDAEVLLANARGCERIQLYTEFDHVVPPTIRDTFRELVRRRARGVPVAYLVGHREFYSMSFCVTPDVLIPRPETELLVVALIDLVKQQHRLQKSPRRIDVADVGTGSGIIAVCAAKHIPQCHVTAIDVSPAALKVAQANAAAHGAGDRIEFVHGDLFSSIPAEPTFDYVVSNPPYVSEPELSGLARDVRDFEPRQALVAGPTGVEVIERLVPQAADRLRPGGWLLLEVSPMIASQAVHLFTDEPRLEAVRVIKDLAGLARVVVARRK